MPVFNIATPDDSDQIANVVASTSEGVVEHLLDGLIPGLTGRTILSAAFMKGEGPYQTENVICSRDGQSLTALLFSYPAYEHCVPPLMESFVPSKRLEPVRLILECAVPDSLYINTIWIAEELRGCGYADALMVEAASRCRDLGFSSISLFCWNDNERAMKFYAKQGFSIERHIHAADLSLGEHQKGASILSLAVRES